MNGDTRLNWMKGRMGWMGEVFIIIIIKFIYFVLINLKFHFLSYQNLINKY